MSRERSGFDRLAGAYRALEFLAFGRALEEARFCFLDRLGDRRAVLVLGEGDGRGLVRLLEAAPAGAVTCVDLSTAMLHRARARLREADLGRVRFVKADLLVDPLPDGPFDAVVTCFVLDCFTPEQAGALVRSVAARLEPGARWLWADFRIPARGPLRWRARAWVALLYAFFRWQTGLPARALPPSEDLIAAAGLAPVEGRDFQAGLVRSVLFSRPTPGG